jgi:penicillin amidase
MKLFRRIFFGLLAILVLLGLSIVIYLNHQRPVYEGVVNDVLLKQNVEVFFDSYGIPHIYGESKVDAYKVLGYLHAQDRLFQMDLMRRVGAGRLSEIFGEELIDADKFYRTLGIAEKSKSDLSLIKEKIKGSEQEQIINAYLEGVNTFIEEGAWPVEYRLLGVEPELFTMLNMFETAGYMAYSFAFTIRTEPAVDFVLRNYQDSAYLAGVDIDFHSDHTFIPSYKKGDSLIAELAIKMDKIMEGLPVPILQGSNSWVLAPSRSESEQVLFANDTHIKFSQPAVWYESHIEVPGFSFYGNFLPGIPFALVGHNKKIAWGLTMLENDDADLYYEKLDSVENKYLFDGEWYDLNLREEEIKIKGKEALSYQVRETRNGPLITDFIRETNEDPVSFWWTYSKVENTLMDAFYLLNTATSLSEAEKAVSLIHAPGLNVNYGDSDGNIAWWAAAKMIKRPAGMQSMFIHDGSDPQQQLSEYWNFEDNPRSVNPPWGYVYSANNQPQMMPDSTWYPGYYAPDNRAKRLNQLIESKDKWNVEEIKSISTDITSIVERDVNASICSMVYVSDLNEQQREMLTWLKEWSGSHAKSDPRPILYYRWLQLLIDAVYHDEFGDKYYKSFTMAHRLKRSYPIVFTDGKSPWWDNIETEEIEKPNEICTETFIKALARTRTDWGANYNNWSWGQAHQLYFEHPLGKVDALKSFFNVGPFEAPGGNETINNAGISLISNEKINFAQYGPQMRIIIDFADIEHSLSINPTGQSGNFMSPHYGDQAQLFVDGKFRKQLMDKAIIVGGRKLLFKAD